MLLSSLSLLLLIACIFGFHQSRELKHTKDLTNKQGLELALVRTQYKHNLSLLSQALKDKDELNAQIKELKIDLECSQDLQIDEDKFQEIIESHVLNVLSHIDLEQAYELACDSHDLELCIEDLVK